MRMPFFVAATHTSWLVLAAVDSANCTAMAFAHSAPGGRGGFLLKLENKLRTPTQYHKNHTYD